LQLARADTGELYDGPGCESRWQTLVRETNPRENV